MPPALCCVTPNLDNREENFTEGKVRKNIHKYENIFKNNNYFFLISSDGHF